MYKGVVFDLDHTLFDRYGTLTKIAPYFCSYIDVQAGMTPDVLAPIWCEADRQCVHLGWPEVIDYLEKHHVFRTVPTVEVYGRFLLGMFERVAVPFPETLPLLETLRQKGYKLGLITNGRTHPQRDKLRMLGLENSFDEILITGEFGVHKPEMAPFLAMAKALNIDPQYLLYIGDNPLNDVEGARKAGYTPVWVRTTGTWLFPEIERPAWQIDHVSELLRQL